MSTIDLILLGILKRKSMNAHEIVKYIQDFGISNMLKISSPAVYKYCKKLHQSNLLEGETVREGEAPQKVIYSVTKEGEAHFITLMQHFAKEYKPFYFDFNVFVWNIDNLPKDEAMKLLQTLKSQIDWATQGVTYHEKVQSDNPHISFASKAIMKQYRMIYVTLSLWIDETIQDFSKS